MILQFTFLIRTFRVTSLLVVVFRIFTIVFVLVRKNCGIPDDMYILSRARIMHVMQTIHLGERNDTDSSIWIDIS
jgi:hypothetical protein